MQQGDDGTWFLYAGHGVWEVRPPFSRTPVDLPELPTVDMRHELAHWIAASAEARELINFGMGQDGADDDEMESRAILVESGLSAIIRASSRIAGLALGGGRS